MITNQISLLRKFEFIKDIINSQVTDEEVRELIKGLLSIYPEDSLPKSNELTTNRARIFRNQILHTQAMESVGIDDRDQNQIDGDLQGIIHDANQTESHT